MSRAFVRAQISVEIHEDSDDNKRMHRRRLERGAGLTLRNDEYARNRTDVKPRETVET